MERCHEMPFGCDFNGETTGFRLWAPALDRVELEFRPPTARTWSRVEMDSRNGWYQHVRDDCPAGTLYRFRLSPTMAVPDPASRYQPEGVHGPSEVMDPRSFPWQDADWQGRRWEEAIVYELHPGCFSPEGNYRGIRERLDYLLELGVTAVQLMPLSQAPGARNWGYDGTYPFAPCNAYGRPDELKLLVQEAHLRGLMVYLDVVYNHFGPEGNYLHAYAPDFFTDRYQTPWGSAINFDGPGSETVRRFFVENALYWLHEYHLDGLRFDAVHAIFDRSRPDVLEELANTVRRRTEPHRQVHLILENDHNAAHYLGGTSLARQYNAQWNDDFHHAAHVLLTGEKDGYYGDYTDNPLRHLERCLCEGFAYQGEFSRYRNARRGEHSAQLPPGAFVAFLQNHDQTGNRAQGERLAALAPLTHLRALVSILLLAPSPPLLFMGEEWGTARPFLYFCDFEEELADAVREGRAREFRQFPQFADPESVTTLPDPNEPDTFAASRLDWRELEDSHHREWLAFYRSLLRIRHRDIIPVLSSLNEGEAHCLSREPMLQVTWTGIDGTGLHLFANCSDNTANTGTLPQGRVLFGPIPDGKHQAETTTLAPWQVLWIIQTGAAVHA